MSMMARVWSVSLIVLLSAAAPVMAQSSCRHPVRPELPSGNPDAREMESAGREIKTYTKQMKEYRDCLGRLLNDAENEVAVVVEGWNQAVERFNRNIGGAAGNDGR